MAVKKVVSIPLTDIDFGDRGREDYGDIEELAANIKEHGQLQPILVAPGNNPGDVYLLIAGGRRLRAHEALELTHIDCLVRKVDSLTDIAELELIENIYRKDLTWQERCTMEYELMGMKGLSIRQMAEELDSTKSQVGRHVVMGEALAQIPSLGECKSLHDAQKSLNKMKESIMAEHLAKSAEKEVSKLAEEGADYTDIQEAAPEDKPDLLEKALIVSQAPMGRDELIAMRLKLAAACYNIGDCIESMAQYGEPQSFHFAEIDPPYGIDLKAAKKQEGDADGSNLDPYNEIDSKDYADFIERVADEVFVKLTTDAFAVFWFGPTHQHATKIGIEAAGFTVNDVPGIWVKESGQTQQPSLNLANCYEPFYVARKGSPPLVTCARRRVRRLTPRLQAGRECGRKNGKR